MKFKNSSDMKTSYNIANIMLLLFLPLIFLGCKDDDDAALDETALLIEEVRQLSQPFKDHSAAVSAGWDVDISGCIQHPTDGGMGHHFGRMSFFDGRINHLEPQVLLFAPDFNGNMEFLGVEYIVPFAVLSEDSTPPTLFDQPFHKNHEQEIWALHV
ncbi:MAG: hypothetical protein CMC08_00350, partial [Flavobacteriaceae bacterium]|nr:hypothetical protein [Flavobacteriaceae bacterium]